MRPSCTISSNLTGRYADVFRGGFATEPTRRKVRRQGSVARHHIARRFGTRTAIRVLVSGSGRRAFRRGMDVGPPGAAAADECRGSFDIRFTLRAPVYAAGGRCRGVSPDGKRIVHPLAVRSPSIAAKAALNRRVSPRIDRGGVRPAPARWWRQCRHRPPRPRARMVHGGMRQPARADLIASSPSCRSAALAAFVAVARHLRLAASGSGRRMQGRAAGAVRGPGRCVAGGQCIAIRPWRPAEFRPRIVRTDHGRLLQCGQGCDRCGERAARQAV